MFEFIKKIFGFSPRRLDIEHINYIISEVEKELKELPIISMSVTLLIKIPHNVSEDLANVFLDRLAKEYGQKLNKKLFFTAYK